MTFVPSRRAFGSPASAYRTVVFWLMMIALAAVLWQMASKKAPSSNSASAMSYSEFMNNVDQNNIASAKLIESQSTARMEGRLRQPIADFSVTIPKEVIPDLTERLRKQGASVEVVEEKEASWANLVITSAPFILILAFWIYIMRQRQVQPGPPPGAPPPAGPIGD
ncbi:MAG TPA: ATP-dependent metallopeptidase FtsH/Yme1/Tma family protein [Candidatus Acidoferrales bacterium]|nr:ATP-dependent metallopeptidase FtsH/Yme1/Tma family protein [Candidatus Acidoferrales bacterium]